MVKEDIVAKSGGRGGGRGGGGRGGGGRGGGRGGGGGYRNSTSLNQLTISRNATSRMVMDFRSMKILEGSLRNGPRDSRFIGRWDRVTATTTPRLTAGQASKREPATTQCATPANRLHGIGRAGRLEAAGRAKERSYHRRDEPLIKPETDQQAMLGEIQNGLVNWKLARRENS